MELSIGNICNFRCGYCFTSGEKARSVDTSGEVSTDHLTRYAEYIKWYKENYAQNEDILIFVCGGEPFLKIDAIKEFVSMVDPYIYATSINTNGSIVGENIDILNQMRDDNNSKLYVNVSYDYAFQNETRHPGSYDTVRDGIRILYNNGYECRTISVLTAENIHRIDELFFDFIEFRKEIPDLACDYNMDRFGTSFSTVSNESLYPALEKIQAYMFDNPDIRKSFCLNTAYGRKRRESLMAHVQDYIHLAMYHDGLCYPAYDVAWEDSNISQMLCYGSIDEPFEDIENKRSEIVSTLPKELPEECATTCTASCKVIPWRTIKTSLSEWNGMPDEGHCRVHKLLTKYLV